MASTNVSVIISAVDKASNVLNNIGKNIEKTLSKQAKTDVSALTSATSGLSGGFGKLAGAAGTVGIAVAAAGAAIAGAYVAMKPLINASIEMENSMMGLQTVARAFGQDMDATQQAAKDLAADGLMTVAEAAAGLKNLLATGFSLPEAINLMNGFKDSASFNRQGMLEFGEAVVGATQGIKNQNSIMVDNSGITKNLSVILEEMGMSQQDLMRVTSDSSVRQKLYNGLLKEMEIFSGDAERAAGTLGGRLSQLGTMGFNLKVALGDALRPAVEMLADVLGGLLSGAIDFVTKHMATLQTISLVVGTTLAHLANTVIGIVRIIWGALQSIFTLSLDPLNSAIAKTGVQMATTFEKAQNRMTEIANKAAGVQTDAYQKSARKIADASSQKKDKVTRDLEKETESFEREMAKREKRFKEQLADMIYAHIEKRDSLIKDLDKENREYEEKMSDRLRDFKDKMAEMVADHAEKVKEINDQIKEEDADYEDRMEERKFDFANKLEEMKSDHDKKVKDIEKQIEKETLKGLSANQQRIADLKDSLAEELVEYDAKVSKEVEIFDRETAKILEEHQKQLASFQAELTQEDIDHQAAILKAQEADALETERIKADHLSRVQDYQEKIKMEEDILNKHQADVAAVKDKAKEDDITRLKRQFEEERKEAEDDHQRKMTEVKERGASEGSAYGTAIGGALGPKMDEIKTNIDKSSKEAAEKMAINIAEGALRAGESMIGKFLEGIKNKAVDVARRVGSWALEKMAEASPAYQVAKALWPNDFKQTGGIVPGAVGEAVPIMAHGGERVTPSNLNKGGGVNGMTFNVYIGLYAGSETEKRNVAKELYSSLVQVAQSQNKSVKELMGG